MEKWPLSRKNGKKWSIWENAFSVWALRSWITVPSTFDLTRATRNARGQDDRRVGALCKLRFSLENLCLCGVNIAVGWHVKKPKLVIFCLTHVHLVCSFDKKFISWVLVHVFRIPDCFCALFLAKICVRMTFRAFHGRNSEFPQNKCMWMCRGFYGLSNKKNRASKELFLTSGEANVYTHTNTNLNTEKRRGILVVTFASAYAFHGFKFTSRYR